MTPERMAELVARWVRLYTRKLPAQVAERRIHEIDADLHDQIAHERAHGTGDRRIALSILSRMVRGLPADASWRGRQARSTVRIVLAVGIAGAVIARFQPEGMARALLVSALATALVAVIALIAGKHQAPISSVYEIVALNGIFVALFSASAWLFRRAAPRA